LTVLAHFEYLPSPYGDIRINHSKGSVMQLIQKIIEGKLHWLWTTKIAPQSLHGKKTQSYTCTEKFDFGPHSCKVSCEKLDENFNHLLLVQRSLA